MWRQYLENNLVLVMGTVTRFSYGDIGIRLETPLLIANAESALGLASAVSRYARRAQRRRGNFRCRRLRKVPIYVVLPYSTNVRIISFSSQCYIRSTRAVLTFVERVVHVYVGTLCHFYSSIRFSKRFIVMAGLLEVLCLPCVICL